LRLLSLVACKFTVVGGRGFTGPQLSQTITFCKNELYFKLLVPS
jgi:hypothetical protein